MSGRRKLVIVLALAGGLVGLVVGTCAFFPYHFGRPGEGPEHRFPVPGSAPLTDEEALALSRKVLELDGRYKPSLQLESGAGAAGEGEFVSRPFQPTETTVSWVDSDGRRWFVHLSRGGGEVIGRSYPGL